ncbi:MAG: alpha/beta hydrolase, partial [Leifsonia sp.]
TVGHGVSLSNSVLNQVGTPLGQLNLSSSSKLMALLKDSTPDELKQLLLIDPALAQSFWDRPPDSADVAAWWASLPQAQRDALVKDAAPIIGNLGGVPYAIRGIANLNQLNAAKQNPNLTQQQKDAIANAEAALKAGGMNGGVRSLVDFNLYGDVPMIALGIGDLDTVDTITYDVPGMDAYASNDAGKDWYTAAQNLYDEQRSVDPRASHGVVAWLGYNTPPLAGTVVNAALNISSLLATRQTIPSDDSVFSDARAKAGAGRLAAELDALQNTRTGAGAPAPFVAVTAHSYGTTTTAYALTMTQHNVNAVDLVASAGIDSNVVPNASALHVDSVGGKGQVYVSQASSDAIATVGRAGSGRIDPADSGFGAIHYSSNGGVAPDGTVYVSVNGHDAIGHDGKPIISAGVGHGYYDPRTESLRNMAAVTTGAGVIVKDLAAPAIPGPILPQANEGASTPPLFPAIVPPTQSGQPLVPPLPGMNR